LHLAAGAAALPAVSGTGLEELMGSDIGSNIRSDSHGRDSLRICEAKESSGGEARCSAAVLRNHLEAVIWGKIFNYRERQFA